MKTLFILAVVLLLVPNPTLGQEPPSAHELQVMIDKFMALPSGFESSSTFLPVALVTVDEDKLNAQVQRHGFVPCLPFWDVQFCCNHYQSPNQCAISHNCHGQCNGVCTFPPASFPGNGNTRWIMFLGTSWHDAIDTCHQWMGEFPFGDDLRGGYIEYLSVELPKERLPHTVEYDDLSTDVTFADVMSTVGLVDTPAEAWQERLAVTAMWASQAPAAAVLCTSHFDFEARVRLWQLSCAWYYYRHATWEDRQYLDAHVDTSSFSGDDIDDLIALHEATCAQWGDCLTPTDDTTWGQIKKRYH